ncbi:MAG: peptidoglycan editing factor PgeF [Acidaminococcaceae bacterium]
MMSEFILRKQKGIWYGVFPQLERLGVVHGFTCRLHGESDILPQTLNLALHVGDNKDKVLHNRALVATALELPLDKITTCEQVHGTKVTKVTAALVGSGAHDFAQTLAATDALITNLKTVPLMLFFADCVPVMLADPVTGVIGLAHAGWRGSVGEIAKKTVQKMVQEYRVKPENLVAAIGPSIGACCYEVDTTVYTKAPKYQSCFQATTAGHWQLDLWQMNKLQLLEAGLKPQNVLCADLCTAENKEIFFSYRAENGKTGRLAAIICQVQ